nr:MAG TPA: hypothetical protein [Caudoviricetes sp.]
MVSWFGYLTSIKSIQILTSWRHVTALNVSYRWLDQAFNVPIGPLAYGDSFFVL